MRPALKKLEDLRPLEEAPRDEYFQALWESIKRCGLQSSLLATEDGLVVDGCRRWAVLQELGTRSYVELNVIEEELSEEDLWNLRTELHVLHRPPTLFEIRSFGDLPGPPADSRDQTNSLEDLIEELLSARGTSARLIQAAARHVTVVVPDSDTDGIQGTFHELSGLLGIAGEGSWK